MPEATDDPLGVEAFRHERLAERRMVKMPGKRRNKETPRRQPPEFLPSEGELSPITADAVAAGEPMAESRFVGGDFSGRKLPGLMAKNSIIEGVSLSGCEIPP